MWMVIILPVKFRILNGTKCNLGKVNLKAMLVSSLSRYTGGSPMPLALAPCDL